MDKANNKPINDSVLEHLLYGGNHVSSGTYRRFSGGRYGSFSNDMQWKSAPATEEEKEKVGKQIPRGQLSVRANNQFVLRWLQANHGLNTGFCSVSSLLCHVTSNLLWEENEINAFLSIKKLPWSSEDDNIYANITL